MNFYQTELLHIALAEELADRFAATLAADYGAEVAQFIARQPDNQTAFENLAHKVVGMVPESRIDEMFDANIAAIDMVLEAQYVITDPQLAAAQLTARSLIRRKEVSHAAPVC